jgi:hypothetical protein
MIVRSTFALLIVAALASGCGGPAETDSLDGAGDALAAGRTLPLWLDHGAFARDPAHPSALVYVPTGFDPTPPLDLVVYVHGFYNCVTNVIASTGSACTARAPARNAYALASQLEASGRNALLLLPEVAHDQASSDPGRLGVDGGLRALLDEALGQLGSVGSFTVDDLGHVVVASHSGGYRAAAGMAVRGGITVDEVWLLDSLYGSTADFDAWVLSDRASLADARARRFADVYTGGAGTLYNSQAMATRARGWMSDEPGVLVDDRTTSTWPASTFAHGLLFKRSGLAHDGVPRYYFGKLLATSGLRNK